MDPTRRKAVSCMIGMVLVHIALLLVCIYLQENHDIPKSLRVSVYIVFGMLSGFGGLLVYNVARPYVASTPLWWMKHLHNAMLVSPIVVMSVLLIFSRATSGSREASDFYIPVTVGSSLLFIMASTIYYEMDIFNVDELGMFGDILRGPAPILRRKTSRELEDVLNTCTISLGGEGSDAPLPVVMGHQRMMSSCPICLESFVEKAGDDDEGSQRDARVCLITVCKHVTHRDCLKDWFKTKNTTQCPVCKQSLLPDRQTSNQERSHSAGVSSTEGRM
ncbi:hypothetical protein FOL47_007331 [Perkinsus chesapeaki]|uniref:RING-type domain-containing protein n=1 Tax=Perkinsus chesapeaki TaxID=330153 RepID=A0A7J6MWY8_PERCH|nr:hypothetical protein FOL47_007331 [Perkinsus chesapeaki]